ncbi:MAG TPA: 2-oxo-4-hydroxy-4-carboxy-5-ureidoimidazoline decarboxylase [Rhodopila sp.]|uniref:2-oxo-4-hydroxy-4-carboxy-5-ureidoimidazoline decarboxylase n=1 Tax=Rhodopila sp. TaxID=2480087 RepID=UPI002CB498FE|nr:2-oxo-4-hydroxy-4-carboxy-5-ureidoimidazoline decarboxylase [Rhodopila sp.]HVY14590.1 2-oxo-4-hydroxy-4-carboxy-5-ureidoimidazoline decarboxylase [Rhodopila sp.]
MHTLDQLNAMPDTDFVAALAGVFEHAPWVAATAAGARPFETVAALHAALMRAVETAEEDVQLEFLRGHPPLSPKAMTDPALTAESRSEQGGLGMDALGGSLARFETGSADYEARFGIPFITCVRRMTPPFVLRGLEQRLANTKTEEIAAALREIGFITRLRLVDRVSGPGKPRVAGHLSTHVLDTARGKAAEGIRIELFREGVLIKDGITNQDGRTDEPLLHGEPLRMGRYELRFHVEDYYAGWPNVTDPPWYDVIPVRFGVAEPEGHYHIPLLLNAWTYSTYRGS